MTRIKDLKWDRSESSRKPPISDQHKQLIADYFQSKLQMGEPRDSILEELAEKYQKSTRQIERYISRFSRPKESSHEQRVTENRRLVALVQKWREEVASYSPVNLLQGWLDKAHEDAITRFYHNEEVEMLYSNAREPHTNSRECKPLVQVENDPAFELLRQRFPASEVWTAFHAWSEQKIPYVQAFDQMLKKIEGLAVHGLDSGIAEVVREGVEGVDWIDCASFPGFDKRCRLERLFTVFVTCDLLACGIAERPSDPYWQHLTADLRKLRQRMNVALSEVTGIPAKGGWISGIMEIRPELPDRLLELTQGFLDERARLRLTEDSLVKALKQLESEI